MPGERVITSSLNGTEETGRIVIQETVLKNDICSALFQESHNLQVYSSRSVWIIFQIASVVRPIVFFFFFCDSFWESTYCWAASSLTSPQSWEHSRTNARRRKGMSVTWTISHHSQAATKDLRVWKSNCWLLVANPLEGRCSLFY